jgi:hypothetical protein
MAPTNGHTSAPSTSKSLNRSSINPAVLNVEYAVRGELALKADTYAQQIAGHKEGGDKLPFDKVVTANIGNPQQRGLDQKPITFWRQVISLLEYPALFQEHREVASKIYPEDAIERAQELYEEIGSVGAYTHSKGVLGIRKNVAKYIEREFMAVWHCHCCAVDDPGGMRVMQGICESKGDLRSAQDNRSRESRGSRGKQTPVCRDECRSSGAGSYRSREQGSESLDRLSAM